MSPVLIGFSTHFSEAFVAADFILIIQSVRLSYLKTLYKSVYKTEPMLSLFGNLAPFCSHAVLFRVAKINLRFLCSKSFSPVIFQSAVSLCPADSFSLRYDITSYYTMLSLATRGFLFNISLAFVVRTEFQAGVHAEFSVVNLPRHGFPATC